MAIVKRPLNLKKPTGGTRTFKPGEEVTQADCVGGQKQFKTLTDQGFIGEETAVEEGPVRATSTSITPEALAEAAKKAEEEKQARLDALDAPPADGTGDDMTDEDALAAATDDLSKDTDPAEEAPAEEAPAEEAPAEEAPAEEAPAEEAPAEEAPVEEAPAEEAPAEEAPAEEAPAEEAPAEEAPAEEAPAEEAPATAVKEGKTPLTREASKPAKTTRKKAAPKTDK